MTLSQAYNGWSIQSQNRKHYNATKEMFRKSWFMLETNQPCSYYTEQILGEALAKTRVIETYKVNAASVMIQVLEFANFAEPKVNPKPDFTIRDLMKYTRREAVEEETNNIKEKIMETKTSPIKKSKRICQLDPETLKVVMIFESTNKAQKEFGITNINRSAKRRTLNGGYYWCYPGEENEVKPKEIQQKKTGPVAQKPKLLKVKPEVIVKHKTLGDYTNEELVAEIRRRGWTGKFKMITEIEL